jgi:hypothetical protein
MECMENSKFTRCVVEKIDYFFYLPQDCDAEHDDGVELYFHIAN